MDIEYASNCCVNACRCRGHVLNVVCGKTAVSTPTIRMYYDQTIQIVRVLECRVEHRNDPDDFEFRTRTDLAMWTAAIFLAGLTAATGIPNPHKITSLPNYADSKSINFDQYAGFISLPSNSQKMFYWLTESESSPSSDPLVLWLNGGPGCSSLGGFFAELGPFVVESDLTVKRNPYAWNRKANMIFLESPAGVGFSQPKPNDTDLNDDITATHTYEFLMQFYAMYPTYVNRPFYVMGESYAGMYVPHLVAKLVASPIAHVNLTGFALGNPLTDQTIDGNAQMDYMYSHGLISIESYETLQAVCPPQIMWQCLYQKPNCTVACAAAVMEATFSADVNAFDGYYIQGDKCLLEDNQIGTLKSHGIRPNTHRGMIGPCTEKFAQAYLNLPSVQQAIHAITSTEAVPWLSCVLLNYTMTMSALPKYPPILKAGVRALIYSGDSDAVINFIGTQRWITKKGLNLTVVDPWKAWFGPDKQLAGYTERYTNLTFMTVKGGGHMVPSTRPLHALYMIECFLYGNNACANFSYPKDALEYLSGADLSADPSLKSETILPRVTPHHYLWFGIGLMGVVAIVFFVWRHYATHETKKDEVKYTELTAEAKPVYSQ
ncbi:Aste57867_370 [Aphanomyces stellatus]|uniref:Carboxypeptidase n=1 Tax=Aphanomyces stellatus TaxID=120398 RepID=A0A485K3F7_9STRA|nr:hypothetical protein As57867_000369 [Aphanomyces stellatus]VFT77595.1 Aste57867_370 [Aphanomyces stellatus]